MNNSVKKTVGLLVALTMVTSSMNSVFASVKISNADREITVDEGGNVTLEGVGFNCGFSVEKPEYVKSAYRDYIEKNLKKIEYNVSEVKNKVKEIKNHILDRAYTWQIGEDESKTESTTVKVTETTTATTETVTETTTATTETATETTTATTETATESTTATTTTQAVTQATTEATYPDYVLAVVNATNAEREKNNLPKLTISDTLCSAAQAHSEDMAKNEYFDHTSLNGDTMSDRIHKYTTKYRYLGENIACGLTDGQSAVNCWMNSDGHRANILNKNYTEIGVGYKDGYWTQDFGG
jgi:uncharacterized protein YkwD